ncbi:MAG: hypothetical protein ACTSRZ_09065 [Promethearchaeota archaeon]
MKTINKFIYLYPKINSNELKEILNDLIVNEKLTIKKINKMQISQLQGYLDSEYIDINEMKAKDSNYFEIFDALQNIFITWQDKSSVALKWRFIHFQEIFPIWNKFEIIKNNFKIDNLKIDLILKEKHFFGKNEKKTIENNVDNKVVSNTEPNIIWCFFFKRLNNYIISDLKKQLQDNISEKLINELNNKELFPKKIVLFTLYINPVSINQNIKIPIFKDKFEIIPIEIWQEYKEANRKYSEDDLIILNNLKAGGFNFSSTKEMIELAINNFNPGSLTIYKIENFFQHNLPYSNQKLENIFSNFEEQKLPIWKGIIKPKSIFKKF